MQNKNMKKIFTTKNTLVGTGVITALVITYLLINKSKKKKDIVEIYDILDSVTKDPNNNNAGQVIIPPSKLQELPDGKFPLKIGDKSKKVYALQIALNKKYGTTIDLDGKMGVGTWNTICDKFWNSGMLSTKITACYTTDLANKKLYKYRDVTQSDYDNILKK
jgi:hypothetical protein